MPGSRKLGRTTDHRIAMLRGLVTYLLENGRIETTVTRAKEVRSLAEKYITIAKEPTLTAKRRAMAFVTKEDVVKKLFDEIAPAYRDRNGGYTRITRTYARRGDAAEMCILELLKDDKAEEKAKKVADPAKGRATRRTRGKKEEAETAAPVAEEPQVAAEDATTEAVVEEVAAAEAVSAEEVVE
jgi:large subunit ribosomal protein L17